MLLDISHLTVDFDMPDRSVVHAVDSLDLQVPERGAVAVVGESGSGKSVSMRAALRLLPGNARISGSALLDVGEDEPVDLLKLSGARLRRVRGQQVGMVFQNALDSLNPSLTIERQLIEPLVWHGLATKHEARKRAVEALGSVGIPDPEQRVKMYPFQLSGGQRQRAMIAMATITGPRLVIADEPTTALDVTVQKQILDLLADMRERGMAIVMITHDLGVARYMTDEAVVLRGGVIQEHAPMQQILTHPSAEYTRMLLDSAIDLRPASSIAPPPAPSGGTGRESEPAGNREAAAGDPAGQERVPAGALAADSAGAAEGGAPAPQPLVVVRNLVKDFSGRSGTVHAVADISFDLLQGRSLGIVGESGSGKSTLARLVMRLIEPSSGSVHVGGEDFLALKGKELRARRRAMQMVFQSPYGSLLPATTVAGNIAEPLRLHKIGSESSRRESALDLLDRVDLPRTYADLYPRQLSGGQQQRVAIARALALGPKLLVADEPTSALDASVQAQVLGLLEELREQLHFSLMLITHNLAIVERYADDVLVMKSGAVVERGSTYEIFSHPQEQYTRDLLHAVLPVHESAA